MADTDSSKYVLFELKYISPDVDLPSDLYLKINEKFIKYRHRGDFLDADKYNLFLSKNLKGIYVSVEDKNEFQAWIDALKKQNVDELTEKVGEEYRDLAEKREDIKEAVFEVFADQTLNQEIVEKLQDQVSTFLEGIVKKEVPADVLAKLTKINRSIADHSTNVANFAVFLGMALGHAHQYIIENIYLGAIFHDYGKAKIPEHILANTSSPMYADAIKFHPLKAGEIIKDMKVLSDHVLTIVQQHHEQYDGNGYPNQLAGEDIDNLAQVVSLANVFENILEENKELSSKDQYAKAIKVLEEDGGKLFDPAIVPRAVDALKLAFIETK